MRSCKEGLGPFELSVLSLPCRDWYYWHYYIHLGQTSRLLKRVLKIPCKAVQKAPPRTATSHLKELAAREKPCNVGAFIARPVFRGTLGFRV